ncbi:MAG TPA: dicarboxylate/amino acid:cation symporter, partial [Alphaproteobacteria bacterium]|nr:dicarboxylate/amino acid:cation symporter [Alphaproteobacteria bacterium]
AMTESGGFKFLRTTGLRIALYFVTTTVVAVVIGIALSQTINPAQHVPESWVVSQTAGIETLTDAAQKVTQQKSVPQLIIELIPVNPAVAVLNQHMLQIVIAAIIAGLALVSMARREAEPFIHVCQSVQGICMKIVYGAMLIAPVAVFGFLFRLTVETGPEMLAALSWYIGTVLAGLLTLLLFYLIIVALVARRDPIAFLRDIRDAQLLAFSSSSSAATMPVSLSAAENKLKVHPEIARLVIPLGTTINMDGTALYQIIVALFLTSLMGIDLTTGQLVILSVTIIGASIGSPGSPGVGLVILSTIMAGIGIPPEAIGIILSVDRLLDMCRTVINVTGDLTAAVVVDRWAQNKKNKESR